MSQKKVPEDLQKAIEQHHLAINQFINGDPRLLHSCCSTQDDVSVIGAWGAYDRGWGQVKRRLDWACKRFQGPGNRCDFENITLVSSDGLAYSVDLEHNKVRLKGNDDFVSMVLRVTTAFRKEDGEWKMVLRHGDPLVEEQEVDTVVRP